MTQNQFLDVLDLDYVHGTRICQTANITKSKWQNVKRGQSKFSGKEMCRLDLFMRLMNEQLVQIFEYESETELFDLLNSGYVFTKPLMQTVKATKTEYERIHRFLRGIALLYPQELNLVKTALSQFKTKLNPNARKFT